MKMGLQGLGFLLRRRRKEVPALGTRELDVLKVLWRGEALSASQVLQADLQDSISLSTIQSTLERLHRKGLLARHKEGRSYLYSPLISRSEFISRLMGGIAEHISDGDMAPMISGFMTFCEEEAHESLPDNIHHKLTNWSADQPAKEKNTIHPSTVCESGADARTSGAGDKSAPSALASDE